METHLFAKKIYESQYLSIKEYLKGKISNHKMTIISLKSVISFVNNIKYTDLKYYDEVLKILETEVMVGITNDSFSKFSPQRYLDLKPIFTPLGEPNSDLQHFEHIYKDDEK